MITLVVVSTSFASPSRERCMRSAAAQRGPNVMHVYIDAAEQHPPKGAMENLYETVATLPAHAVVVALDGDDWLPHPDCLARVAWEHEHGAWLTWGQFQCADGSPGFAGPYAEDEDPRTGPWRLTHLKTFRAGLFQRIRREHLQRDGQWLAHARDRATMYPMFEMTPPERRRFIPDVICTYDWGASFDRNASPAEKEHERLDVEHVRRLPRYARIEAL